MTTIIIKADACDLNDGKDAVLNYMKTFCQTEVINKVADNIRIVQPGEGLVILNRGTEYSVSIHKSK